MCESFVDPRAKPAIPYLRLFGEIVIDRFCQRVENYLISYIEWV